MHPLTLAICSALALLAVGGGLYPELRRKPEPPAGGFPSLPPLAELNAAAALSTPEERRRSWREERRQLRRRWEAALGPLPRRGPVSVETLSTETLPDHLRLLLRYPDESGRPIEAYLLLPRDGAGSRRRRRRPGVVVLHQTSNTTLRDPVGLDSREPMHMALHLVRRGYVCLAPRNVLWSRPELSLQQVTDELLNPSPSKPGEPAPYRWKTGMAKMLWDARRATDVLAARPEVNPRRLGCIGHSLGGKEVLYLAAFDPRIRATISCEGGIGIPFSNWEADWYLGKQAHSPTFGLDHHSLLALVAPRAFMLIGGSSADGPQSWPYLEAALPAWRILDAEDRLGLFLHTHGHDFPPPGPERERVYGWLDHWLAPPTSKTGGSPAATE